MSLIHDALTRARRDAAAREVARRGLPAATPPPRRSPPRAAAVALALAALAAGGVGLAWLVTGRDATPPTAAEPSPTPASSQLASRSAGPTAAPSAPRPATPPEVVSSPPPGFTQPPDSQGNNGEPASSASSPGPTSSPTPPPTPPPPTPAPRAEAGDAAGTRFLPPAANASAPLPGRPTPPDRAGDLRPAPPPPATATPSAGPPTPTPRPPTPAPTLTPTARPVRTFVLNADLGHTKVQLDYIVYKPSAPFASINGQRVVVGTMIGQARVVAIEEEAVHLEDRSGLVILRAR